MFDPVAGERVTALMWAGCSAALCGSVLMSLGHSDGTDGLAGAISGVSGGDALLIGEHSRRSTSHASRLLWQSSLRVARNQVSLSCPLQEMTRCKQLIRITCCCHREHCARELMQHMLSGHRPPLMASGLAIVLR